MMKTAAKLLLLALAATTTSHAAIKIVYLNNSGTGYIYGSDSGVGDIILGQTTFLWQWSNVTQQTEISSMINALTGSLATLNGLPTTVDGGTTVPTNNAGISLNTNTPGPLSFPVSTPFSHVPGGWTDGLGVFTAAPVGGAGETFTLHVVPEPSTYLGIATGLSLVAFVGVKRFRNRKNAKSEAQA